MCCRGRGFNGVLGFPGIGIRRKGRGLGMGGVLGYGRDGMVRLLNADMTEWVALHCVRVFIF